MQNIMTSTLLKSTATIGALSDQLELKHASGLRRDRWVVLVVIAIALVLVVGLAAAWWITCQNKGLYPALDMPSFNSGGTWRAYCR